MSGLGLTIDPAVWFGSGLGLGLCALAAPVGLFGPHLLIGIDLVVSKPIALLSLEAILNDAFVTHDVWSCCVSEMPRVSLRRCRPMSSTDASFFIRVKHTELLAVVSEQLACSIIREPYDTLLSDTMATDPSVEPMPLSSTRFM